MTDHLEKQESSRSDPPHLKGADAVNRDRQHMAEIGRKGGEAVSQDRAHMSQIGRKGGEAVSQDRSHMEAIGKKGGEATHLKKENRSN